MAAAGFLSRILSGLYYMTDAIWKEGNVLFNDAHFIYGYMASDIW